MGKDSKEYLSFEEALGELQVDQEELKKMVSDEEIRAFRDSGKLKFKVDEVLRVKERREEQPTIILPTDEPTVMDEADGGESPTVVEIETPQDLPTAVDDMPSETLASDESPLGEELVPTLQMDAVDDDIGLKEEEEIISPLDETAGIGLADDEPPTVTEELDAEPATAIGDDQFGIAIADEEEVPVAAPADDDFAEQPVALGPAAMVEPYVPIHPAYVAVLIVGILVLIFAGIILIDTVRMPQEIPPYLRGISQFILDKFAVQ